MRFPILLERAELARDWLIGVGGNPSSRWGLNLKDLYTAHDAAQADELRDWLVQHGKESEPTEASDDRAQGEELQNQQIQRGGALLSAKTSDFHEGTAWNKWKQRGIEKIHEDAVYEVVQCTWFLGVSAVVGWLISVWPES